MKFEITSSEVIALIRVAYNSMHDSESSIGDKAMAEKVCQRFIENGWVD